MSEEGVPVDGRTALELEITIKFGSIGFICPSGFPFGDAIGAAVSGALSVHGRVVVCEPTMNEPRDGQAI